MASRPEIPGSVVQGASASAVLILTGEDMTIDPRIVLKAMNDDLHDCPVESDADREHLRHMLLVRAVVLVACELRGLRETYAARGPI
jgi:hypothetical protein